MNVHDYVYYRNASGTLNQRRVWRYEMGNQNPYIEQTTQWEKNVQKDKRRSTKYAYKIKDRVTRTPLKIEDELMCSGRVSSSCSTSGTRRVNLVTNPVTSMFLFLSYFSSVICFINKELLLTQKLLNLGFLAVKLKSSLPTFHGHDVNRCGISVLLLVPLVDQDLLTRPKALPVFNWVPVPQSFLCIL
jgi:hypothetical protein